MQLGLRSTLYTTTNKTSTQVEKETAPSIADSINLKLDALDKKFTKLLEENMNFTLDTMEKRLLNVQQNISGKLDEMLKKIPEIEQTMNATNKIATAQNSEKKIFSEVNKPEYTLSCKKEVMRGNVYKSPFYQLDDQRLKYVEVRNDAAGLTRLEMHLAIKGTIRAHILLSPKTQSIDLNKEIAFEIGVREGTVNLRRMRKEVEIKNVTNILSPTLYTAFYIKINNGTLIFGKDGSSTPLISYSDALLKTIKYFSFGAWEGGEASFLYDCPTYKLQPFFNKN